MNIIFNFPNRKQNKQQYSPHNIKYFIIAVMVLVCIILLCKSNNYINISIIGDNSNDNSVDIKNSETTVVTLSTDETTAIPDS